MSWIDRLNNRFGRYAAPNVTLLLIIGQVIVYIAEQFANSEGRSILPIIQLNTAAVLKGEFWLLVTFLFSPPLNNAIFAFFFWYFFYLMGTTLEENWGAFRYNLFLAIGYFASLAFAFFTAWIVGPQLGYASNAFLYGSVFLTFARLYPEFVIYIFFVLPVQIKWLARLQWAMYALSFLFGSWSSRAMVLASVLNFLLFFGRDIWLDMKHADRRMRFQARTLRKSSRLSHECRVCGLSSADSPKTAFRYCSECGGDYCYCPEHLANHEHVRPENSAD